MVEEVALDSSVFVSALVKGDKFRPVARLIMEKIFLGEYRAIASVVVRVEVCGAISKRSGLDKAIMAEKELFRWESMNFIGYSELTIKRMKEATELAIKLEIRGMDAIVVQVAKERKRTLITFDEEMAEKARAAVKVLTRKDFAFSK